MSKKHYYIVPGIIALAMLSACEPADNDPGPGGVTVSEARELDEAATMLDAQRIDASDETKIAEDTENPSE